MKERPILFNGAMVRAVLDGHKTQTRRVVKGFVPCRPEFNEDRGVWEIFNGDEVAGSLRCPYGIVGDRLWVRETHYVESAGYTDGSGRHILYRADGEAPTTWTPSIHMHRWASRITLEITDVRVQRLQDITAADCRAEGHPVDWSRSADSQVHDDAARDWYSDLWDSIHGPRGYAWPANPWVWVITFQRLEAPHAGRE